MVPFLKKMITSTIMLFYQIVPIWGEHGGINTKIRQGPRIIISLTSYPKRFRYLHLVIKSLMLQSVKADKIILYLGEDAMGITLPRALTKLHKSGLEINFRSGNLLSHKKYFYAMQEYPEDIVILADDDILYEPHMVKRLMASYVKYPKAISAKRVHRMAKNIDGRSACYNDWEYECKTQLTPALDLFPTSGAGTLFPPHCLDDRVFDQDCFMKECWAADDVWLKFMQLLHGTPTVFVPGPRYIELPDAHMTSLSAENVWKDRNDIFIRNLERLFKICLGDYCDLEFREGANYTRLNKCR